MASSRSFAASSINNISTSNHQIPSIDFSFSSSSSTFWQLTDCCCAPRLNNLYVTITRKEIRQISSFIARQECDQVMTGCPPGAINRLFYSSIVACRLQEEEEEEEQVLILFVSSLRCCRCGDGGALHQGGAQVVGGIDKSQQREEQLINQRITAPHYRLRSAMQHLHPNFLALFQLIIIKYQYEHKRRYKEK